MKVDDVAKKYVEQNLRAIENADLHNVDKKGTSWKIEGWWGLQRMGRKAAWSLMLW